MKKFIFIKMFLIISFNNFVFCSDVIKNNDSVNLDEKITNIETKISEISLLDFNQNNYKELYKEHLNEIIYDIDSIQNIEKLKKDSEELEKNEYLKKMLFELRSFLLFNYLKMNNNNVKEINSKINIANKTINKENKLSEIKLNENEKNKNDFSFLNKLFIFIKSYYNFFMNKVSLILNELKKIELPLEIEKK